jgi:hypothetical protein
MQAGGGAWHAAWCGAWHAAAAHGARSRRTGPCWPRPHRLLPPRQRAHPSPPPLSSFPSPPPSAQRGKQRLQAEDGDKKTEREKLLSELRTLRDGARGPMNLEALDAKIAEWVAAGVGAGAKVGELLR